jgi:hypothetical protein
MMDEAATCGLRYDAFLREKIAARANPDGEQYDSRSGVAGYYRYGPRQVAALCDDKEHGVKVPTVRVHPAAFERIAAWRREYEPVSLSGLFNVGGKAMAPPDAAAMEDAWDLVWWRRAAYFTTLGLTAFVALFALRLVFEWPNAILKLTERWLGWLWSYVTWAIGPNATGWISDSWTWLLGHIGAVLPGWASPAIPSFKEYPLSGIVALALLAWAFFMWSGKLERRIEVLAEWAWAGHKCLPAGAKPKTDWRNAVARMLRPITAFFYRWLWRGIFVPLLGIAIGIVALVLLSPYWIWRLLRSKPWM